MDLWDEHREAARRHHELRAELAASGTWPNVVRLRTGNENEIDRAITFLEANPICVRSGYRKERILKALAQLDLTDGDAGRLTQVVIDAVCDPWRPPKLPRHWNAERFGPPPEISDADLPKHLRREFKWYARLARDLPTMPLRGKLLALRAEGDRFVAHRARLVLGLMSRERPPSDSKSVKSSAGGPRS